VPRTEQGRPKQDFAAMASSRTRWATSGAPLAAHTRSRLCLARTAGALASPRQSDTSRSGPTLPLPRACQPRESTNPLLQVLRLFTTGSCDKQLRISAGTGSRRAVNNYFRKFWQKILHVGKAKSNCHTLTLYLGTFGKFLIVFIPARHCSHCISHTRDWEFVI
jgi:hypothetical protein